MKGSEKQIKWAEEIKKEMIDVMEKHIECWNRSRAESGKEPLSRTSMSYKVIDKINETEDATWFINNRGFQDAYWHKDMYVSSIDQEEAEYKAKANWLCARLRK